MQRQLPSATVTFLFTDVEGSTRLLQELGAEAYAEALAEHRRVLRKVLAAEGGVEVDTQGDAFFYVFTDARAAVAAGAAGNVALEPGLIRIRMGLHTGEALLTGEGYVGEDVHLGARIAAAGHGGQVLLSAATRALLDGGVTDLGEHRVLEIVLRGGKRSSPSWKIATGPAKSFSRRPPRNGPREYRASRRRDYFRRAAAVPPIDSSATTSTITAHHAIASVPSCQVRTSHMPTAYA
jgi:class 3 adenylate cyclase